MWYHKRGKRSEAETKNKAEHTMISNAKPIHQSDSRIPERIPRDNPESERAREKEREKGRNA